MILTVFLFFFRKQIRRRWLQSEHHVGVDLPEPARSRRRNPRNWRRLRVAEEDDREPQPKEPLPVTLFIVTV